MKKVLEVLACDIDEKFPAKTYTITCSDGRSIEKDLCEEHAEPFEEWLEEADFEPEGEEPEEGSEEEPEPAPAPVKKAPAKKAPAKKTPAKKAPPARRRPRIVTLEEIEAQKKG
ncbi:DNA binding protein [Streptomyces phage Daudau]|uniref:DNA binding protein n=1 Tax=Streptomyces phage Daudau TaxID=2041206 RepID=A0A291LH78_9CAUD|nr:hypothetical protein KGG88_gp28 [Streptomyces phage Daudau]ATI18729.1 DNA binding protein [Streptomyces phage Daudau]